MYALYSKNLYIGAFKLVLDFRGNGAHGIAGYDEKAIGKLTLKKLCIID